MARRTLPLAQLPLRSLLSGPGFGSRGQGWSGTVTSIVAHRLHRPLALALAALTLSFAGGPARAQSASPNQPLAIDGMPPPPCPLLVPGSDYALQPLRIQPSQVARKNAVGCLSPADAARYGPDGCPLRLCRADHGVVPLPLQPQATGN